MAVVIQSSVLKKNKKKNNNFHLKQEVSISLASFSPITLHMGYCYWPYEMSYRKSMLRIKFQRISFFGAKISQKH